MGGLGSPEIYIRLEAEISKGSLIIVQDSHIVPDVVDGVLASDLASVTVRNETDKIVDIDGIDCIDVRISKHRVQIVCSLTCSAKQAFDTVVIGKLPIRMLPNQSRPLSFRLNHLKVAVTSLQIRLEYSKYQSSSALYSRAVSYRLSSCDLRESHKYTFLHPSNTVSYAIIRPPSHIATSAAGPDAVWPVMVNLHGAGLAADSEEVRHSFDGAPDLRCWLVSPTGMTAWSGDDWRKCIKLGFS